MSSIEARRREMGLTQAQLAGLVGASQATISMIELGGRTPSLALIQRIAAVFECTVDDLLKNND